MRISPNICVVDDDPSICRALGHLLKSAGFRVSTHFSARAFLQAGDSDPPDVLILDLHMPGMDGLELQRHLSASGRAVPIVFISAHEDDQARDRAMGAGALAFFRKPFDEKDLLEAIRGALESSPRRET